MTTEFTYAVCLEDDRGGSLTQAVRSSLVDRGVVVGETFRIPFGPPVLAPNGTLAVMVTGEFIRDSQHWVNYLVSPE